MRSSYPVVIAITACTHGEGVEDDGLQSLAASVCEHARACGCEEAHSQLDPADANCETMMLSEWEFYVQPTFDDGRPTLDRECHERALEILRAAECDTDLSDYFYTLPCSLYHGTANVGDPCEGASPTYNPCLQGLACIDGRCDQPYVTGSTELGPGPGESCAETGECNSAAWCDTMPMEGPICRALGDVGDDCTGHRQCLTTYCPAGECEERPGEGQLCGANGICADGLACVTDRCMTYHSCVPLL